MIHVKHTTPILKLKKATLLKSSLCDRSDTYIFMKGTTTAAGQGADAAAIAAGRNNKQVLFKNCTPFTNCVSHINNIQVDLLF